MPVPAQALGSDTYKICDDLADAAWSCQRKAAFCNDFGFAALVGVVCHYDDLRVIGVGDEAGAKGQLESDSCM